MEDLFYFNGNQLPENNCYILHYRSDMIKLMNHTHFLQNALFENKVKR